MILASQEQPRVLIVEDSRTQAEELRLILESDGLSVDIAQDGRVGLERLMAAPFDLVLTDVLLPGQGGRSLAEALTERHPGMKVIYVSGFTPDEGVRTGEFPPGSRFLQKPFTLSALVDSVKQALTQ